MNRPAIYQKYMNNILFNYLDDFCTAYLNDILIYFKNKLKHKKHICKVLQQLCKAKLQANIQKLEFSVKRIKYLRFIISTNSIKVDLEKTFVIN
jgi:Reverse transcriptase (RNA-dependent DNA polymerase)